MKTGLVLVLFLLGRFAPAQSLSIRWQPLLDGHALVAGEAINDSRQDPVIIHTLRLYLGQWAWRKGPHVLPANPDWQLPDLELPESWQWTLSLPASGADSLVFQMGVDSATTARGALDGALDPTKGMFWTWQSGYINAKLEGQCARSRGRDGLFEWHLGGYTTPWNTVRRVALPLPPGARRLVLALELRPLLEQADWTRLNGVMSPCAEAARMSQILANTFVLYAE
jgi:hypothetical protein